MAARKRVMRLRVSTVLLALGAALIALYLGLSWFEGPASGELLDGILWSALAFIVPILLLSLTAAAVQLLLPGRVLRQFVLEAGAAMLLIWFTLTMIWRFKS
jgi:hypothetical protein